MKVIWPASHRRDGKGNLYNPARSSFTETAIFITLGLVGLCAVIIAFLSGSLPASPNGWQTAGFDSVPVVRYLRSGQLAADARTANAMIQYLFDLQPGKATNLSAVGLATTNSSLLLNRATLKRDA